MIVMVDQYINVLNCSQHLNRSINSSQFVMVENIFTKEHYQKARAVLEDSENAFVSSETVVEQSGNLTSNYSFYYMSNNELNFLQYPEPYSDDVNVGPGLVIILPMMLQDANDSSSYYMPLLFIGEMKAVAYPIVQIEQFIFYDHVGTTCECDSPPCYCASETPVDDHPLQVPAIKNASFIDKEANASKVNSLNLTSGEMNPHLEMLLAVPILERKYFLKEYVMEKMEGEPCTCNTTTTTITTENSTISSTLMSSTSSSTFSTILTSANTTSELSTVTSVTETASSSEIPSPNSTSVSSESTFNETASTSSGTLATNESTTSDDGESKLLNVTASSTTATVGTNESTTTEMGVCNPQQDPTCPTTATTINTTAEFNTTTTESKLSSNATEGVCNPIKDPTCPTASTTISTTSEFNSSLTESMCPTTATTINTTAEFNTTTTESKLSSNATEGVCNPIKDPTCPTTATTINTTAEFNTTTTESKLSSNATEGVCNPIKDPTCPTTATTINTTAEFNTTTTESKLSSNATEGVCNPIKDPTCPTTATTINTTAEFNTTTTESKLSSNATEGVCNPIKDPTCPTTATTINTTAEFNTTTTESKFKSVDINYHTGICQSRQVHVVLTLQHLPHGQQQSFPNTPFQQQGIETLDSNTTEGGGQDPMVSYYNNYHQRHQAEFQTPHTNRNIKDSNTKMKLWDPKERIPHVLTNTQTTINANS
ncbi:mucin-2-like [Macrobrachium nipponense]|uniref:mucin-2-like n=1 Tax=Macrobrachium nipponense TaxID=159736 RepID=UPI0030C8B13C